MRIRLLLLLFAACQTTGRPRPRAEDPGVLLPPERFEVMGPGVDFLIRQRIEARFGSRKVQFEAALQRRGDLLTLLGLTPFGTRAFVIEQRGQKVRFERFVDKEMPFQPRYILLDVQRTLMPSAARADGVYNDTVDGAVVEEVWEQGKLQKRTIRRPDRFEGALIMRYEGGLLAGQLPPRILFENGWFGYSMTIENLEIKALSAGAAVVPAPG